MNTIELSTIKSNLNEIIIKLESSDRSTDIVREILTDINKIESEELTYNSPEFNELEESLSEKIADFTDALKKANKFTSGGVGLDALVGWNRVIDDFYSWLKEWKRGQVECQDDDYQNGYADGDNYGYEKGVNEGFLAGIDFVYQQFPFLADTVDQRIKDDDFADYTTLISGIKSWNEDKWDKEVEAKVKQIIKDRKWYGKRNKSN